MSLDKGGVYKPLKRKGDPINRVNFNLGRQLYRLALQNWIGWCNVKEAQPSFNTFEIIYFFKSHTKTLSFHCMLNAIKWKFTAFHIKELHLHGKLPTGNENFSILWLKCYTWKYNNYYLYANYIYYQYWITASKDLLKYLETLQSKYIFFPCSNRAIIDNIHNFLWK